MCEVDRARRLTFGGVAELYDQARPSYPSELVDDVIALAGGAPGVRALEVGAGTGKATVMVAARGMVVRALEPSPQMAAIARRNCRAYPGVTIDETDLERWTVEEGAFALVFSAQAWHWVTPSAKYPRARQALVDGGLLAAFWNRPRWKDSPLRDELRSVYLEFAPDLGPDPGPGDPAVTTSPDRWEDWDAEIEAAAGFVRPEVRLYEWTRDYASSEYVRLLHTYSDHIVLADDRRAALTAAVSDVIERHGGTLRMSYVTKLCLAVAR